MQKYIKIFFLTFLLLCFAPRVYAQSFYAQLNIKEVKVGSKIQFSLDKATALYGNYDSFYQTYNKDAFNGAYILEVYNAQKKMQSQYSLDSSRFAFYDTKTGGGVRETDSGVIGAIIPYAASSSLAFIKINNQGTETNFISLPTAQLAQDIAKIPLCRNENEAVDPENGGKCCSGLIAAQQSDKSYVCVNCGDGKCSQYENYNSCPLDCAAPKLATTTGAKKSPWNILTVLLVLGVAIVVLVVIIFVVNILRRRRIDSWRPPQNPLAPPVQ